MMVKENFRVNPSNWAEQGGIARPIIPWQRQWLSTDGEVYDFIFISVATVD
jgi:hypothetical protein